MPAWVGIEYMAQAIAAHVARRAGARAAAEDGLPARHARATVRRSRISPWASELHRHGGAGVQRRHRHGRVRLHASQREGARRSPRRASWSSSRPTSRPSSRRRSQMRRASWSPARAAASAGPSRCAWRATASTSSCIAAPASTRRRTVAARGIGSARACCSSTSRDRAAAASRARGRHRGARRLLRRGVQRRHRARQRLPGAVGRGLGRGDRTPTSTASTTCCSPLVMPMVRAAGPGASSTLSSVSGADRQPRPGQLQRRQGRHHRRDEGAGDRARQAARSPSTASRRASSTPT